MRDTKQPVGINGCTTIWSANVWFGMRVNSATVFNMFHNSLYPKTKMKCAVLSTIAVPLKKEPLIKRGYIELSTKKATISGLAHIIETLCLPVYLSISRIPTRISVCRF